ncbi:hypothetical protein HK096_011258, partial [Nowakowskiella sp. JEL0078]
MGKGPMSVFHEFDFGGIFLLCLAWFLILYPLNAYTEYEGRWTNPVILGTLISGVIIHILVFPYEIYFAKNPIIPLSMAMDRTVIGGCLSVTFMFMSWYMYTTYFSSYLYLTRNITFTQALWISNAWSFASVTSSIVLGGIMRFNKRFLIWAWVGFIILLVGNAMMVELRGPENSEVYVILTQVFAGIGDGFLSCATQVGVQAALPHKNIAIVTAVYLSVASFGGAVGSIISQTMWETLLPTALSTRGISDADITIIVGSVFDAHDNYPDQLSAISSAYTETSKYINIASVIALIPIFVCLIFMKNLTLSDDE